jgi:hypothetical protein
MTARTTTVRTMARMVRTTCEDNKDVKDDVSKDDGNNGKDDNDDGKDDDSKDDGNNSKDDRQGW